MGKRSNFDRIPRDLYETIDPRAVAPLLPYLEPHTKFAEPCAGNLALVRQLEAAGHSLYWGSDIVGRDVTDVISGVPTTRTVVAIDALELTTPLQLADIIITNPPWTRTKKNPIMHNMIEHFRRHNAAWLLLDANWAFTKQSSDYMKYCSMVVAVGRVIWIPGTKVSGKEDAAWYRMEREPCYTIFVGR